MGGIVAAGAQIIGGNKAADAQSSAASSDRALAQEIFDQQRADLEPFRLSGVRAQQALDFELGLGERPVDRNLSIEEVSGTPAVAAGPDVQRFVHTGRGDAGFQTVASPGTAATPSTFNVDGQNFDTREGAQSYVDENNGFNYRGFQETPGYQFQLDEGNRAAERSSAARGSSQGGAFAKDLTRFGQGLANQEYNNYLNRLGSQSGSGQVATNSINAAAGAFGQTASNAIQRAGSARASGFLNVGNTIANGIFREEDNASAAAATAFETFGGLFMGGA